MSSKGDTITPREQMLETVYAVENVALRTGQVVLVTEPAFGQFQKILSVMKPVWRDASVAEGKTPSDAFETVIAAFADHPEAMFTLIGLTAEGLTAETCRNIGIRDGWRLLRAAMTLTFGDGGLTDFMAAAQAMSGTSSTPTPSEPQSAELKTGDTVSLSTD